MHNPFFTKRNSIITVLIVLLLGNGLVFLTPHIVTLFSHRQFSLESSTLTILTKDIPLLPPHTHEVSTGVVDSIFSDGHGLQIDSDRFEVPFDMWVTGISNVSRNAPKSILHHLKLFKEGYPNPVCAKHDEEIYTIGADTKTELHFSEPFGIFLKKGTKIYLSGMVHNPLPPRGEGDTYKNVSIGYRLTYERDTGERSRPMQFYRLFLSDEPQCTTTVQNAAVFTVPSYTENYYKEASSTNQGIYTFTTEGLLLGAGGHLHPEVGGKEVRLYKNSSLVHTFTPVKLPDNSWGWVTPVIGLDLRIAPGDTFSIGAMYSNENALPVEDAMGIVGFFVAPDDVASAMQ